MKGDQVPFGGQLSEIKEKSSMKEQRRMLVPIHLPTSHRLPIFEVSHVSVPKREMIQSKQGFYFEKLLL